MKKNRITSKNEFNGLLSNLAICSFLLAFSTFLLITSPVHALTSSENPDLLTLICIDSQNEECTIVSNSDLDLNEPINIEEIYVYELEEEVSIDFDTKQYLPEGFNPLKGIHALDWNTIELIEPEYEMDIDYITSNFRTKDYKPLNSLDILDWDTIIMTLIGDNIKMKQNIINNLSIDITF